MSAPTAATRAPLDVNDDRLARCIQCGLCLPSCPTFALTPLERANPRGRIGLMRAVARGEMALDDPAFAEIGPVEVRVAGIEEMRDLRSQEERKLIFPILSAYSGDALVARRMGMRCADVAEERRHILEWIEAARHVPAAQ